MGLADDLLIVAVGAFTGAASPIEVRPRLRATLHGSNEARVVCETHAVTGAPDTQAVRAVLALLGGTREAADILPTLGLVVVPLARHRRPQGAEGVPL